MKLLLTMVIVLGLCEARGQTLNNNNNGNNSGVSVFARVDVATATANGTGIRGVTLTNLTQNTTAIVQNFFSAGGVDLQPSSQAQGANAPGVTRTILANNSAKRMMEYRNQLEAERLRLAQLIGNTPRPRQSAAVEIAKVMAIERAIQQTDRQLAVLTK